MHSNITTRFLQNAERVISLWKTRLSFESPAERDLYALLIGTEFVKANREHVRIIPQFQSENTSRPSLPGISKIPGRFPHDLFQGREGTDPNPGI